MYAMYRSYMNLKIKMQWDLVSEQYFFLKFVDAEHIIKNLIWIK